MHQNLELSCLPKPDRQRQTTHAFVASFKASTLPTLCEHWTAALEGADFNVEEPIMARDPKLLHSMHIMYLNYRGRSIFHFFLKSQILFTLQLQ
jgi:hypothetical protein